MIHLVRHAPTADNTRGVFQGSRDVPASPVADPGSYRVPRVGPRDVRTSPLRRALTAVEVLFPGEPYVVDERLAERAMGELEGLDHATVRERWPTSYRGGSIDPSFDPPGGESMRTFADRVVAVLREADGWAGDLYLVTHNGWIRTATFLTGRVGLDELFDASVPFLEPIGFSVDLGQLPDRLAQLT